MAERISKAEGAQAATKQEGVSQRAKQNNAWFERKVAELKTELEKLPGDRQAELFRNLEERSE